MKRRGFLGLLGGAAVAGPKVAADVGQSLTSRALGQQGLASYGWKAYSGYDTTTAEDPGDWRPSRIAEIKKMLLGVDSEDDKRDFYEKANLRNMTAEKDIMALHSVSNTSKIRMFSAKQRKFQREQQRRSLLDELFNLEGSA